MGPWLLEQCEMLVVSCPVMVSVRFRRYESSTMISAVYIRRKCFVCTLFKRSKHCIFLLPPFWMLLNISILPLMQILSTNVFWLFSLVKFHARVQANFDDFDDRVYTSCVISRLDSRSLEHAFFSNRKKIFFIFYVTVDPQLERWFVLCFLSSGSWATPF
jgi:hypothetical protein